MDGERFEPPKKDNITHFKKDTRLFWAKGIKIFAVCLIFASLIFAFVTYGDDFDPNNVKRLLTYAKSAGETADSGFSFYNFEPGLSTVYAPFDLGLAVVSSDTYQFVSGYSDTGFSKQINYGNPAMCTSDRWVLIYDKQGYDYSLVNAYSVVDSAKMGSPILSASMNKRGDYALVTAESGYRSGVYVYDYKGREQCVWRTPDFWVIDSAVSTECDYFAVLCLSNDSAVNRQIRVYTIGETQPDYIIDFGKTNVYSLKYYNNDDLHILCEDGFYIYSKEGEQKSRYPLDSIAGFAHHEGQMPIVAQKVAGTKDKNRIVIFGQSGTPAFDSIFEGTFRDLDFYGEVGAVLFTSHVLMISVEGEIPREASLTLTGGRSVMCTQRGDIIAVFPSKAEKITPHFDGE